MRFMFLIHSDSDAAPTPELFEAMHALAQREVAAGRMIYDAANEPKKAHFIAEAGHNDLMEHGMATVVTEFLDELPGSPSIAAASRREPPADVAVTASP